MFTVCTACKNCILLDDSRGEWARTIWYNMLCKAHPLPRAVSPLTGKVSSIIVNDFGQTVEVNSEYDYCRDHNEGDCPDYVPNVS